MQSAGQEKERKAGVNELITVIIPVYNVEKYLARCIGSVLRQSYEKLEILLVDDGSTDRSGAVCRQYAAADSRILAVHKANGGLSSARNTALDQMRGKYVTFVDSDDFIHEKMIEVLYRFIQEEDADLACCECERGSRDHFTCGSREDCCVNSYTGRNIFRNLFNEKKAATVISCAKLYRAEIFSDLRYPPGKIHEDEFLIHHILSKCRKTVYTDAKLYYHFFRRESISNSRIQKENLVILEALCDRNLFFEKKGDRELIHSAHVDYMRRIQFYYYSILKYIPEEKKTAHEIRQKYRAVYDTEAGTLSFAQRMRYGLFIYFPWVNYVIKALMGARKV